MGRGRKNGKVIVKKLNDEVDMEELNDLFGQLAGDASKLDPEIILDKYTRLKNNIERCGKILTKFKETILDRLETKKVDIYFNKEVNAFMDFVQISKDLIKDDPDKSQLIPVYQSMKESYVVEQYLLMCKTLLDNNSSIKDKNNLSDAFIKGYPGTEFFIFPFANINFKFLFSHFLEENTDSHEELEASKKYVLLALNMLYITTYDIYQIITSPDVDIDRLTEVIIGAVASAKKQIPRCDKAFKVISNSVDLLKNNMNDYYKAFVSTSNPTIIIDNFLNDLRKTPAMSNDVIMQFKKIAMFFRKQTESQPKNPKLETMFTALDKVLKLMDADKTTAA